jgi:hypothetical protein
MAAAISRADARAPQPGAVVDRDARLAARAGMRGAVQRGLFDRRAEREAEQENQAAVVPNTQAQIEGAPEPVLLLFVTS